MPRKGFSLIESLISIFLFLIVVIAALEFCVKTKDIYFKLKKNEETEMAARAALDKMRIDILASGEGLLCPMHLGLLEGIQKNNDTLLISCKEKELSLQQDLIPGQTRILLGSTSQINKGQELCIFNGTQGEIKSISAVYADSIILSSPISFPYSRQETKLALLKKISYYLDKTQQILRRKVNSSPAQPLLEDTHSFNFNHDKTSNLARVNIFLNSNKEKKYELFVFPKNTALSLSNQFE